MLSHPAASFTDIEADVHGESAASRTYRDPAGTCRHILAAAVEEFARDGFAGAHVDVTTRCVETSERMLYYYYDGKEKLFLTVLEHMYFCFKKAEEQVQIGPSDPREAVIQFARFVWDLYYKNPELIRLLNSENLRKARHLKTSPYLGELVNPVIEVLRGMVEHGWRAGIFRDDADMSRLYLMISALGCYVLSNHYTISAVVGRDIASADKYEAFVQLHTKILLAYLDRPKG